MQIAQGGRESAVVADVVAVVQVYEDLALGRDQPCKLLENFQAAGGGKDVPEDIPETGDDIEVALDQVKRFGAHGPEFCVGAVYTLHRDTWLYQNEFRNV